MNVTIKDIARRLDLSYSSISRALNGKEGVSEETRKKIMEIADELGYQPNELARGLVNKVSKTIGVIIPDINNPFFGEIVTGIIEAAKENSYDVFLCISNWDIGDEKEYFSALMKKRVDGIIVKPAGNESLESYDRIRTPLMIIERHEKSSDRNSVEVDNELGGYMAVRHLLDCGYKKPAVIIGKEDMKASNRRLAGAERALLEAGDTLDSGRVVKGSFSIEGGRAAAKELFDSRADVDSVFALNDLIGLGVLQYLSENQVKVPKQVGVIGFDDISYAGLPQIQLTTIRQPKRELGRILCETLLTEINGKEGDAPINITLDPELIVRKTTARK